MSNLRLKANKAALEDLLNEVADLDLSPYTEESSSAFRTALASAQPVLADETLSESDQASVTNALAALQSARDGLVAKSEGSGDGNQSGNTGNGNANTGNNGASDYGNNNTGYTNTGHNNPGNNNSNSVSKAAKTGDTASFAGIMMLVLVSGAAAAVVLKRRTR